MALEHVAGVCAIAFVNWKFLRPHFNEDFAQKLIDIGSFVIVFLGVGTSFLGTFDEFWFVSIMTMIEGLTLGLALLIEQFHIIRSSVNKLDTFKPKPLQI